MCAKLAGHRNTHVEERSASSFSLYVREATKIKSRLSELDGKHIQILGISTDIYESPFLNQVTFSRRTEVICV